MSKYTAESIYGTFFTMLDNLSKENQDFLMKGVFSGNFLDDIKDNPKKAYAVLNDVVFKIEDGGKDKVSELLSDYKDKIYMMKNMLKDYGNFKEKKIMTIKLTKPYIIEGEIFNEGTEFVIESDSEDEFVNKTPSEPENEVDFGIVDKKDMNDEKVNEIANDGELTETMDTVNK